MCVLAGGLWWIHNSIDHLFYLYFNALWFRQDVHSCLSLSFHASWLDQKYLDTTEILVLSFYCSFFCNIQTIYLRSRLTRPNKGNTCIHTNCLLGLSPLLGLSNTSSPTHSLLQETYTFLFSFCPLFWTLTIPSPYSMHCLHHSHLPPMKWGSRNQVLAWLKTIPLPKCWS